MHAAGMTLLDRTVATGIIRQFPFEARRYGALSLFPRRSYDAGEITWEVVVGHRGAASLVDSEGSPRMIARDGLKTMSASPAHIKEGTPFTQKEISILRQPGAEVTDRQARIVGDQLAKHNARRLTRFNWMASRCLSHGTITLPTSEYGPAGTATYGFPVITAPSPAWSDASAKILSDFETALRTFRRNAGYDATHVLWNSELRNKLLANTQIMDFVGKNEAASAAVLSGNLTPLEAFNSRVRWVDMAGAWENDSGTVEEVWPANKLTLIYAPNGVIGEWATERNSINDLSGDVVSWSHAPEDGDKGKINIYAYDNGIPVVRDLNAVQTWEVYTL